MTKSVGNCGFGHIYWRNPKRKIENITCGEVANIDIIPFDQDCSEKIIFEIATFVLRKGINCFRI